MTPIILIGTTKDNNIGEYPAGIEKLDLRGLTDAALVRQRWL